MQAINTPTPIEQPAAAAPEAVTDAAIAPAVETPAREPVKPPEYAAANEPSIMPRDPVVKLPTAAAANDTQFTPSDLIILPDHVLRAEKNLAAHLGKYIAPALTQGLELTLLSTVNKGATDVKLCLAGPMVPNNEALIGGQVLAALKDLPNVAPLFDGAHPPHFQKPTLPGQESMVHIHIPQLTTAQYAGLIQSLAQGIVPIQKTAQTDAPVAIAAAPVIEIPTSIIATPASNTQTIEPEKQLANGAAR